MLDLLAFKATDVPAENLIRNGDFSQGNANWLQTRTVEVVDGIWETDNPNDNFRVYQHISVDIGSRYCIYINMKRELDPNNDPGREEVYLAQNPVSEGFPNYPNDRLNIGNDDYELYSLVFEATEIQHLAGFKFRHVKKGYVMNFGAINLTEAFGEGNEPSAEQMNVLIKRFPNNWFEGTKNLFNADNFMSLYFKEMRELRSAITTLGGS